MQEQKQNTNKSNYKNRKNVVVSKEITKTNS